MDKLKKTMVGLPNTCAECGKELVDEAYALNDDQARAGQIFCAQHASKEDRNLEREAAQEAEALKAKQEAERLVAERSTKQETERTAAEAKKTERKKGGRIT